MSLESWKYLLEIGGVILLGLTFVTGAGLLYTSTRINERQAERLRQFEKELTSAKIELGKQQERAANAEKDLLNLQTTARYGLPRRIVMGDRDGDKDKRQARFKELSKYAGTLALVQAVPEPEAQTLAFDITTTLKNSGWNAEIVSEAQSHIPSGFIKAGVQVVTLETFPFSPSPEAKPITPTISPAGRAAQAVVELLSLDLGPPFGPPFFGVNWQAEYREHKFITKYGFEFPKGAVVILVGIRPMEYSPVATAPPKR